MARPTTRKPPPPGAGGTWRALEAKARFSELVRRAREEGPQRVTVHGRPAVIVTADDASDPPARYKTLHDLFRDSPFRDLDFKPVRERGAFRRIKF